MSTEAAKPPPQANVSIESVLGVQQHNALAAHRRRAIVLGDDRAHHHLRRDELPSAGVVRDFGKLLQHHPQFRFHRHHGARHDGGDRDRRHRSLGRVDHGTGGGRERSHPGGGLSGWAAIVGRLWARGFSLASSTDSSSPISGLSPFVTTLGMLAIARSCAVVLSGNRMLYKFGPGGPAFKISRRRRARSAVPFRCPIRCCS